MNIRSRGLVPFTVQWKAFEINEHGFMTIRIAPLDKSLYVVQAEEIRRLVAAQLDESTARYSDRKLKFGILCGSI
jgi:hypothetical protein